MPHARTPRSTVRGGADDGGAAGRRIDQPLLRGSSRATARTTSRAGLASSGSLDRSDRKLGIHCHGRLAVAHVDPAQRRLLQRAAQRRRKAGGRYLGPVQTGDRRVQAVRCGGHHACAGPSEDRVGQRHDPQNRGRCRTADTAAAVRQDAETAGGADVAGILSGRVGADRPAGRARGQLAAGAAAHWFTEGRDHEPSRRLPAQERRAVQRRHDRDRILRSLRGGRERVAHGLDDCRRPEVPRPAVPHEHTLQAGTRRVQVDARRRARLPRALRASGYRLPV